MPLLTTLGGVFGWVGLTLIMLVFGNKKTKHLATWAILTMFIVEIIVFIIKTLVGEPRPFETLPNVNLLQLINGYSFPSGHATVSFALGIVIGASYNIKISLIKDNNGKPRQFSAIYLFIIFAVIVAFSRVYVGVHYPLDILVGSLLGTLIGLIMLKLYRKNIKIENIHLSKVKNSFIHKNTSIYNETKDDTEKNND